MPIHKIEEINTTRYLAIWHIEESIEELTRLLDPADTDKSILEGFRSDKKKFEWLAGRVCIKSLCKVMGIYYKGLTKNNNGKPFLIESTAEVSMSHSYPYVAALIDSTEDIGIDLEQPKEKLRRVAHKFLSDHELNAASDQINALCIYWCAKETLYKICDQHINFREQMAVEDFELCDRGHTVGKVIVNNIVKSYKLEFRIEKDYILTFNL
ncbi:4'-phosphopantetheinyl transferase superfamily protein [Fulvivirga sp. 29W222]|uniref:4'-phosphopantetheinyl transferase superfamily protein n=1 Tax=Fulvivirga marina TaxID=2494733 RepID=A0A937FUU4_9BACT|nr:4'-phosphopantetheinyl transferase family protein [Fulvivirga marina]MBL6446459.1 4'-phosphopantetheinyl transferase superfamily protein [Fulvivirga marina]